MPTLSTEQLAKYTEKNYCLRVLVCLYACVRVCLCARLLVCACALVRMCVRVISAACFTSPWVCGPPASTGIVVTVYIRRGFLAAILIQKDTGAIVISDDDTHSAVAIELCRKWGLGCCKSDDTPGMRRHIRSVVNMCNQVTI